jgi:hypothetical protein
MARTQPRILIGSNNLCQSCATSSRRPVNDFRCLQQPVVALAALLLLLTFWLWSCYTWIQQTIPSTLFMSQVIKLLTCVYNIWHLLTNLTLFASVAPWLFQVMVMIWMATISISPRHKLVVRTLRMLINFICDGGSASTSSQRCQTSKSNYSNVTNGD